MEREKIWNDFESLPAEAQQQVADLITLLRRCHGTEPAQEDVGKISLAEEPFVGLWSDREDVRDSGAWVRRLRGREWVRRCGRDGSG